MKVIIVIGLIMISPILGEQEQDQEELDYYDIEDYFDAPVLKPSEFTIEELVNPNFHINPESTLTFNYNKVTNGQSPKPIEKRKESVRHYLRVRKPTTKRVIYHINRNKPNEDVISSTLSENLKKVENKIKNFEESIATQAIADHEEQTLIPNEKPAMPVQQNENGHNEMIGIAETTQSTLRELADSTILNVEQPSIAMGDDRNIEYPSAVSEKHEITNSDISSTTKLPRFRMRTKQKRRKNVQPRTTEISLQTMASTLPTKNEIITEPSTVAVSHNLRTEEKRKLEILSGQKRGQGRKWLQSTASPIEDKSSSTPYYNNKLTVPHMRFRLRKRPAPGKLSMTTPTELFTPASSIEQQFATKDNSLQEIDIDKNESLQSSNQSPDESTTGSTSSPDTNFLPRNKSVPQNKLRIVRRKFPKLSSSEKSSWPVRRNRLSSTESSNLLQYTELDKITPDYVPVTEKTEATTIEATVQETTTAEATTVVSTVQYSKKRRNFGRKRLRLRPTISTPANTAEGNTVNLSVNTDIHTVPNLDTTTNFPRMRYRNRFRKVKANYIDVTSSTDETIMSSSTLPSTTTGTQLSSFTDSNDYEQNSMDTSENSESLLQEKPKSRFSKDNPPPPVPTLSPWYDGFGK